MKSKEDIILKTAINLFLKNGYENTNLKDIINVVGGSYTTIYKKFKSKNELFLQALDYDAKKRISTVVSLIDLKTDCNLKEFLDDFAPKYFKFFYSKDNINFMRLVSSRAHKDKKLKTLIDNADKTTVERKLSYVFEEKISKEVLNTYNTLDLSNSYFSMLRGCDIFKVLLNADIKEYSEEEIKAHAQSVNSLFLNFINSKH